MNQQFPNYQTPQQQEKITDPFWFRKNQPYLVGVTSNPSNPMLAITNIKLTEASQAQQVYGYLYNGMLTAPFGTMSFQIRVSKNGAPMIVTESRKTGQDAQTGKDKYFETTLFNVQAKAQILRYMEAVRGGQFVQQPQQPQYSQNQYSPQVPQYNQAPQQQFNNQAPTYNAYVPQQQNQPQYEVPTQHMEQQYSAPQDVADSEVPVGSGAPVTVGDDDLPF